jgi:hypothetical protein
MFVNGFSPSQEAFEFENLQIVSTRVKEPLELENL